MRLTHTLAALTMSCAICSPAIAQDEDREELKLSAMDALIMAPPERALPIATRVLQGDGSDELKERALFILSQIDLPEAETTLLQVAREGTGDVQEEAIRMIGISGKAELLGSLKALYASGDEDVKDAVLEAYLIADDVDAVFAIAEQAETPDEFGNAVEYLGAMGATDRLRELRNRAGMEKELIEAYAIAGDVETLLDLARDSSRPDIQAEAIEGLAITDLENSQEVFMELYRGSANEDVREAALEALFISDNDEALVLLYRESTNNNEKGQLLEYLSSMDSDLVWDLIEAALEEEE
ncbi:MAG: HEAT repeat domain-containing protein [Pseudomonadota bacterium]